MPSGPIGTLMGLFLPPSSKGCGKVLSGLLSDALGGGGATLCLGLTLAGGGGGCFGGPSGSVLLLPRMKDGIKKSRNDVAGFGVSFTSAGLGVTTLGEISSVSGTFGGGLPRG